MSQAGRQDMGSKVHNAVKVRSTRVTLLNVYVLITKWTSCQPDSQKGVFEQAGDAVSGTMDNVASGVQPQVSTARCRETIILSV